MKTFIEFCEEQHTQPYFDQALQSLIELECNPWDACLWIAKNTNSNVEVNFLETMNEREKLLTELWGQLWRNARRFGAGVTQGATTVGQGMWDKARAVGGDIASAGRGFMDKITGPEAKAQEAEIALKALLDSLQKNPQIDQQITNRSGRSLIGQLQKIIDQISRMKDYIPRLNTQRGHSTSAATGYQQGTRPAGPVSGGATYG